MLFFECLSFNKKKLLIEMVAFSLHYPWFVDKNKLCIDCMKYQIKEYNFY